MIDVYATHRETGCERLLASVCNFAAAAEAKTAALADEKLTDVRIRHSLLLTGDQKWQKTKALWHYRTSKPHRICSFLSSQNGAKRRVVTKKRLDTESSREQSPSMPSGTQLSIPTIEEQTDEKPRS